MSLSTAEITQYLKDARAALHSLNIGQAVVEVRDSSGEMVRYTPANASRLRAYIRELEDMLGGRGGRIVRPMVPTWG